MIFRKGWAAGAAVLALVLMSVAALAADFPAPKEGAWTARDFKFHTGEVMPELKLAYTTVGEPTGEPVLVLHGTTGSAASMLDPISAANCSARASRSTPRNTSSSSRTRSATANRPNPPTACAPSSRSTITTTWSRPTTASSRKASASATCAW